MHHRWPSSPFAHTYSIVARDRETGDLGVAVQSHWFSVGSVVSWAEAGVGAVATQAFADPNYGKRGLEMMKFGSSAPDALRRLLAADERREIRQVAMVDARGRVSVHTGIETIPEAGHAAGDGFSVQANMMLNSTVWGAMKSAFEDARGDLADRMLAALDAAQREGGDVRGMQSAAMVVVRAEATGKAWTDRIFDLRIDDHPDPLNELRRLIEVQRAYGCKIRADAAFAGGDLETGAREYCDAEKFAPGNPEFAFWHAVGLMSLGKPDDAATLLRRVFEADRNWVTLATRMAHSGLMPCEEAVARDVIENAKKKKSGI